MVTKRTVICAPFHRMSMMNRACSSPHDEPPNHQPNSSIAPHNHRLIDQQNVPNPCRPKRTCRWGLSLRFNLPRDLGVVQSRAVHTCCVECNFPGRSCGLDTGISSMARGTCGIRSWLELSAGVNSNVSRFPAIGPASASALTACLDVECRQLIGALCTGACIIFSESLDARHAALEFRHFHH